MKKMVIFKSEILDLFLLYYALTSKFQHNYYKRGKLKKIYTCTSIQLLMERACILSYGRLRLHKIRNPFIQHRAHDLVDRLYYRSAN